MKDKISLSYAKVVFALALPSMIQQLITSFANLVDNMMVASNGKDAINAVGISNQMFFVIMLIGFGLSSGVGVFIAQQFGSKKFEQMHYTFIIGIVASLVVGVVSSTFIYVFKEFLFSFFTDVPSQYELGAQYLQVAVFSYTVILVNIQIGGAYRSCSDTVTPMIAGIAAIVINTSLNYVLINGNFGAPALGVQGAAIATLTSRIIELIILIVFVKRKHMPFVPKIKDFLKVPKELVVKVFKTSLPLCSNEFLWALGTTAIMSFYGSRSADYYTSVQIAYTFAGLLWPMMGGYATAVAILVGQDLGAKDLDGASKHGSMLLRLSLYTGLVVMMIGVTLSFLVPIFYSDVDSEILKDSSNVLRVVGLYFPIYNVTATLFFILRAGGDVVGVLIMDSLMMWFVAVPLSFIIIKYVMLGLPLVFFLSQSSDFIKLAVGVFRYKKRKWLKTLV